MQTVEQKACPFCNGRARMIANQDDTFEVECMDCRATGQAGDSHDEAARQWNARFEASLPPSGIAEMWQPIETAKRDTKAVLIWVPENQCSYAASWRDGKGVLQPGWAIFGGEWRENIQRATHWRPLPAPPADLSNKGVG